MHKLLKTGIFPILLASVLLFTVCSSKSAEAEPKGNSTENLTKNKSDKKLENTAIGEIGTVWYYFTQDETSEKTVLKKLTSPDSAPKIDFKPWTEALRVSGLGLMYEPPLFLVNRAGILPAFTLNETPKIELKEEFLTKTAEGFYKTDAGSLIRLYTNTIFSSVIFEENSACLLRYNSVNGEIINIITPKNFDLEDTAQLSALEFNSKWYVSFKIEKNEHVHFDYFYFSSFDELLKGNYTKTTQEKFISAASPLSIKYENDIGSLLKKIGKNVKLEFFGDDLKTKQIIFYQNSDTKYEGDFEFTASACKFKTPKAGNILKAMLFANGDIFYFNADTKEWIQDSLPKLPNTFLYTYFTIENDIIIAAWEEQQFFETGRSGLLLYKIQ